MVLSGHWNPARNRLFARRCKIRRFGSPRFQERTQKVLLFVLAVTVPSSQQTARRSDVLCNTEWDGVPVSFPTLDGG